MFLCYSQCLCFVAGCLLFFAVKGKRNTEEEQERRTTRKEDKRTIREHISQKKNNKHKDSPCHKDNRNTGQVEE